MGSAPICKEEKGKMGRKGDRELKENEVWRTMEKDGERDGGMKSGIVGGDAVEEQHRR